MPKYPDITVQLTGKDGNAFNILGICLQANYFQFVSIFCLTNSSNNCFHLLMPQL